jgi:methyl-accepting chemotaxis protein
MADEEQKFQRKTVLIKRSLQLRYIAMLFVSILVAVAIVGIDMYWTLLRAANDNPAIMPVIENLQHGLMVKFILYCGIIAIVSLFISNRIAGPVYRFEQSALVVGSGDLTHRVRLRQGDEFMELQDEFNDMVSRLQGKALQDRNLVERLSQRLGKMSLEAATEQQKQELTAVKNEVDHLGSGFKV